MTRRTAGTFGSWRSPHPTRRAIRTAVVGHDESLLAYFRESCAEAKGIAWVGTLRTGTEALTMIPATKPEVVLMPSAMPDMSGFDFARNLRLRHPEIHPLMVTTDTDDRLLFEALMAGVSGYLVKPLSPQELHGAIRSAHSGGFPLSPTSARSLVSLFLRNRAATASLSVREQQVLSCLLKGESDKDITEHLGFGSSGTTHSHISHILTKLHVHSRAEAVRKFLGGE